MYIYDLNAGTAVTSGTITTRTAVQPAGATVVAAVSGGSSNGGSGRATPSTPTAPPTPSTPTQRIIVTPSTQAGVPSATVVRLSLFGILLPLDIGFDFYIFIIFSDSVSAFYKHFQHFSNPSRYTEQFTRHRSSQRPRWCQQCLCQL